MIVFRTDASADTGFGRLKRSTYLASLLKNKTEILFSIGGDKTAVRYLEERNFSSCPADRPDLLDNPSVKCILFDLRRFNQKDIRLIRRAKKNNIKTVQITDLGLSQQEVDYTIDSSMEPLSPYMPEKTVLSGPDFAILHNKFRHFNKVKRKYRKTVKNVFICFGGAVDYQVLRKIVDLLSRRKSNIKIAPGFYLKRSACKILKRIYPGIRFVGKTDTLARAFFEADIAVITTGVTAFEAAAAGTPALYFYSHDEQKAAAHSFEKKGAGLVIAHIDDLLKKGEDMLKKMTALSVEDRIRIGTSARKLVDARGVYRIIDFFEKENIF
jgi:spore coat polysaccharide biosynthesis predicted glycosyltransferase SpsG